MFSLVIQNEFSFVLQSSSHSEPVTCVDWGCGNDKIYSGSSDQHIVEWSLGTGHEIQYVIHTV